MTYKEALSMSKKCADCCSPERIQARFAKYMKSGQSDREKTEKKPADDKKKN